jgi:hypothetical protein
MAWLSYTKPIEAYNSPGGASLRLPISSPALQVVDAAPQCLATLLPAHHVVETVKQPDRNKPVVA